MLMDKVRRAGIHIPVGVFAAWVMQHSPVLGFTFSISFIAYEIVQDWRTGDRSFKDILGFLIGLSIGALVFFAL